MRSFHIVAIFLILTYPDFSSATLRISGAPITVNDLNKIDVPAYTIASRFNTLYAKTSERIFTKKLNCIEECYQYLPSKIILKGKLKVNQLTLNFTESTLRPLQYATIVLEASTSALTTFTWVSLLIVSNTFFIY